MPAADVKSLLEILRDVKVSEAIDRTTANYEQYELGEAKAVHVTAYKGADKALELFEKAIEELKKGYERLRTRL